MMIFSFRIENFQKKSYNVLSLCNGQFAAMDWLNKPTNYKKSSSDFRVFKELFSEKYEQNTLVFLIEKNVKNWVLGAFLSVNQGSSPRSSFHHFRIQLRSWKRKNRRFSRMCPFDTGGISIKPSANLHYKNLLVVQLPWWS